MAIQHRRGSYTDLDPTKAVQGEWLVVLTDDPNAQDGKAAYLGFGNGSIKRMATYNEVVHYNDEAREYANEAKGYKNNAASSATSASQSATSASNSATQAATSATQAAESATSATSSATAAANSATAASNSESASAISESNASESAAQAALSATQAASSATESASSATSAANSATQAANSASSISTSATQAANSALQAANSATSAANSADSASDSATSAENSATIASNAATSASNSATAAANSASDAEDAASSANSSSEAAALSATQAKQSETSASNSASAASTSETNAANSAASALSSKTAAANSATAAASSASDASDSATAAASSASDASDSATDAATSATQAANSASDASDSATAASTSASQSSTSATNASGSATAASNSATAAANSASDASNSATAASGSATAAAGSASDAATSATAASTSASNASSSATSAANSASSAANSATAAATSKNDAQTILDNATSTINTAKTNAISDIGTAKTTALSDINTAKTTAISDINTTKTTAISDVNTTKTSAISDVDDAKEDAIDELEEIKEQIIEMATGGKSKLEDYGITDAYTKTEVDNAISEVQSTVLRPGGSLAASGITQSLLTEGNLRKVYNITEDFVTTSDFVEGAGKALPAGTNIYIIDTSSTSTPVYKFDVLAGSYGVATQSGNGLMSSTDKTKLDNADVTAYTNGNGISISNHEISAVVDTGNGLSLGASGIVMAAASQSNAGAMSASDKTKLDGADVTAYTSGDGISIVDHEISAVVNTGNGLSLDSSGITMNLATTSSAGAMSASDKTKLDGADVTAYSGSGCIKVLDHIINLYYTEPLYSYTSLGYTLLGIKQATSTKAGLLSASLYNKLNTLDYATNADATKLIMLVNDPDTGYNSTSYNASHTATIGKLETFATQAILPIKQNSYAHIANVTGITSENGIHGIRYYDDALEVYADSYEEVTPESDANPLEEGWYELINDEYILTEDTSVTPEKEYYQLLKNWQEITTSTTPVEKTVVAIPVLTATTKEITGGTIYAPITGYDANYMDASNYIITNPIVKTGVKTVFSLKDPSTTVWNDGTVSNKEFEWDIIRGVFRISKSISGNSITISNINSYRDITITYTNYNASNLSFTSTNPSVARIQIRNTYTDHCQIRVYLTGKCGEADIKINASENSYYLSNTITIHVYANINGYYKHVYGVEWDGTSTPLWTRTDDSAEFDNPVPAVNNGDGSSPFDNCMPWSGIKRIQHNDCGTLVEIPKYYYKWTREEGSMKLQIADGYKEGFLVSPAHADRGDGEGERDFVYVGAYHCSTSDYTSSPSVKPKTGITRASFRQNIHNLGTDVWQWDFAMVWTIWMLYLVEYANWDSQEAIGFGCGANGSSTENNGLCDEMIYHTGTNKAAVSTYGHVRYRWIEDLWANTYDFCDGIYFNGAEIYGIANPADFSDTDGGVLVGERVTSTNNIKAWTNPTESGFEYMLFPSEVISNSSYNSFSCDSHTYSSSGKVLRIGHYYSTSAGRKAGMFEILSDLAANGSNSYTSSRLQKLPSANS